MDGLIVASKTTALPKGEEYLTAIPSTSRTEVSSVHSPEDALKVLEAQPDLGTLTKCLRWLASEGDFNIKVPSPKAAQIINALVNEIFPNYWQTFQSQDGLTRKPREFMLICLSSLAGIGAIVARLRSLITLQKNVQMEKSKIKQPKYSHLMLEGLELLQALFQKDNTLARLRRDIWKSIDKPAQRALIWKEIVTLFAAGKLLSTAAEAEVVEQEINPVIRGQTWISSGQLYAAWLGRNILTMADTNDHGDLETMKSISQILSRALTLGYTDAIIGSIFQSLIRGDDARIEVTKSILDGVGGHDQKTILYTLLRLCSGKHSSGIDDRKAIGGVSSILAALINEKENLHLALVEWLLNDFNVGVNIRVNRAVIVALSLQSALSKKAAEGLLKKFGEKLYIQHAPVLHQEVNTQLLLLLFGRLHHFDNEYLINISKSSIYLNAISNRLAASSPRSQFLGMVVGNSVSDAVDAKDKRLNFSIDEGEHSDAKWYAGLIKVKDSMGSISDLKVVGDLHSTGHKNKPTLKSGNGQSKKAEPVQKSTSKIIAIEEIMNDSDREDYNLPVFAKPDSDPEDSDDDPTVVERNKPSAPVYIRDLISGLRDVDNYGRYNLALKSASNLLRRKANFGTEVSDHIEELATILVGLANKYNEDNFQEWRLQGMIAILVARPLQMGQWFSNACFNGDYSLGQRASILTTLSMGARELAGYQEEDAALTGSNMVSKDPFPSKKLPDKYHKIYAIEASPVNLISQKLEQVMIQPMAIDVAEKLSGPTALKVRTFSSRMEVEKKRKRPITNELAKIVAEAFFLPLTGRWRAQAYIRGPSSPFNTAYLLTHFLKTVALIFHASGPSTVSLPMLTRELWALLLSLRGAALGALPVTEALLFALLTVLEVNGNDQRRLAEENAQELLETQAWAEQVFERVGGGSEEGERVRMLAAGVLTRAHEVVEKYQRLLMGDLVDFI